MEKAKVIANVFGIESRNGIEFIKGNREVVDMEHVSKIKSAMERGEFVPPILIDRATKFVIDGQHRFMAACSIWREGKSYVLPVIEGDFPNPLLSAIHYNSKSKKWETRDYVDAYIADGRESYQIFNNFCMGHKLLQGGRNEYQYKAAAQLLTGTGCSQSISKGTLRITPEQIGIAHIAYCQIEDMIRAIGPNRGAELLMKRDIVLAWLHVRDLVLSKMTMQTFCKKLAKTFICPTSDQKRLFIDQYMNAYNRK